MNAFIPKLKRAVKTKSSSKKSADKFDAAIYRALKNPANRPWKDAPKSESKYVMRGGVPHKIVNGKLIPLKPIVK